LWGERGAVGRNFDVLALWRAIADEVSGGPLPGAHYLAEECPDALLAQAGEFFGWR
jgi:haloacetate dehalogenase